MMEWAAISLLSVACIVNTLSLRADRRRLDRQDERMDKLLAALKRYVSRGGS